MNVRERLNLTFVVVVGLLAVPSLYAATRLAALRDLAVEGRAGHAAATYAVGQLGRAVSDLDRYLRGWAATGASAQAERVFGALGSLAGGAAELEAAGYGSTAAQLAGHVEALDTRVRRVGGLIEAGAFAAATDSVLALDPAIDAVDLRLGEIAESIDVRAAAEFRLAEDISRAAQNTTLFVMFAGLVVAAALSFWATQTLSRPISRLRTAMVDVAAGDFEGPWDLPYDRDDEIGVLSTSFRTMAERLKELDRLKIEFLGMASHELKTPINVIRGYTELIEEELAGELTDAQRGILGRIAEQTITMSRLVSHLMDISRLESGNFGLEVDRVLVADLLLGLERRFEILAKQKGVELRIEQEDGAPEWIDVDVDMIRDEVLGNLVSNALKFTPEGGTIRVEARGDDGDLVVRVSDTGTGIREESAPYVFEKYYQVERSRAMGSGLGLAIAKELVEAHGGGIRLVDPGEGTGAVFEVELPAATAAP